MDNVDNRTLARLCRAQAKFASTAQVWSALTELAEIYDSAADRASAEEVVKAVPKKAE
jgi:hypothetical protein